MLQYRFLLLSLLLGAAAFVLPSVKGETYCVKVNKNDTCQCPDIQVDDVNCLTLQYFINNASTANKSENGDADVTLYFMPGNHSVHFPKRINITGPAITLIGTGGDVTINASRGCLNSDNTVECGLHFEGSADKYIMVRIENLTLHRVSIKLKYANVTLNNSQHLDQSLLNIGRSNVTYTGKTTFARSNIFTTFAHDSNIMLSGYITFTQNEAVGGGAMYLEFSRLYISNGSTVTFSYNTALDQGGAIYLDGSRIYIAPDSNVTFANNTAKNKGGAIYFEPGITLSQTLSQDNSHNCFYYQWLENSSTVPTHIDFINNSAIRAGDHIHGASISECLLYDISYESSNSSLSLVSSEPLRVCLCQTDSNGKHVPQCDEIFKPQDAYPGEKINIWVAVVGWDYETGITTGVVYQNIKIDDTLYPSNSITIAKQKKCMNVDYTLNLPISENKTNITMFMYLTALNIDPTNELLKCDEGQNNFNSCIHYAPVTYEFSMDLTCPPGFHLFNRSCDCLCRRCDNVELFKNCSIFNHSGYFTWDRKSWVGITNKSEVIYAEYCPFNYCSKSQNATDQLITVNLPNNTDSQCAYNRTGMLCGQCKDNFSLAIGSSRCIECNDYKGLSFFIFFAAAGLLVVFLISALNLTVTQGMINGLLFYANVLWAYQSVFLPVPQDDNLHWDLNNFDYLLRVFIAWINLDFGIETCFVQGFNAIAKTLLQYFFPLYLWTIAGAIIISARHSTKVTNLVGNRAVPLLATLLLLSSTKLLKIILDSLAPTKLTIVNEKHVFSLVVWSLDGNLPYFLSVHALIFLVAVFFFIFLWLPYTLLLFFMQWIQRKSHLRLLKWVPRLTPIYDAYFAPLKDKHHYWFGMLLVTRCVLLIFYMVTKTTNPRINYVLLLVSTATLLMYGNYYRIYKSKYVQFSENFFFVHLNVIGAVSLFDTESKYISDVVRASVILVLLAFCGWVIWSFGMFAKTCYLKRWKKKKEGEYDSNELEASLIRVDDVESRVARYRDSILEST